MTLSWPPAPGVSARWLAHARRLAALPEDAAAHAPVSQSGLDALCGAQQQPATVLAVIEILSAPTPATLSRPLLSTASTEKDAIILNFPRTATWSELDLRSLVLDPLLVTSLSPRVRSRLAVPSLFLYQVLRTVLAFQSVVDSD